MLRYYLLGPLAVDRDGEGLDLGPPQQRAVLAVLAQAGGATVSTDRIVDAVWGEDQPGSVQAGLQAYVSRLRRLLRDSDGAPSPIVRHGNGYLLDVTGATVDVDEFADLAATCAVAVHDRRWHEAAAAGTAALALWRGHYLADLQDEEWVRVAAAPLAERRSGTAQNLITALLGDGDVSAALAHATELAHDHPLDERVAWLHAVALHRAGRTSQALTALRGVARHLDEDLGLETGPALRDLQTALLRQDPDLAVWPVTVTPPTPATDMPAASALPLDASEPADIAPLPFVGRDAELGIVTAALSGVAVPWVVLVGPAGIGKTRLAHEAAQRWSDRTGGVVVRAQCPDLDERPPWWVVRQLLREIGMDPAAVLIGGSDEGADAAGFAVLDRVVALVRNRAAAGPVLLLVDDLHWIDASSARFLTVLAESGTGPGPSVLLTSRPHLDDAGERLLDTAVRRPGGRRVAVSPLAAPDVATLVASVSGETPTTEQAAELADRTGGTPFAIVEFARQPPELRFGPTTPDAVRLSLRRRFAALPAEVHTVLQIAAVLGDPIDIGLLAAVHGRGELDTSESLDAGADAEVLVPALDGERYTFAHALLRDELRAEVPNGRQQRWHATAADAVKGRSLPDVLRRAGHLRASGSAADAAVALAAYRDAADRAERDWLPDLAASWWSTALDTLSRTDADDERDEMVIARTRALARAGRGPELLEALDSALVDALRDGRPASAGRLAATLLRVSGSWPWPVYGAAAVPLLSTLQALDQVLGDHPAAHARVLAVTAVGLCYHPDPSVPDSLSTRAIGIATAGGDTGAIADAMLGRALTYSGVASHARESVELLDQLRRLEHENAAADRVLYDNILTMAMFNLGRTDALAVHLANAVLGADVHRMTVNRVQLRWCEAALALWRGDLARAEQLYAVADHAHRRTELQQTGTFELAALARAWDRGRIAEAPTDVPTNPMVSRWFATVVAVARDAPGADDRLRAEVAVAEPEVWTSHGRLTLLAHAVADRGLTDLAAPLLAALLPVRHCLAAFGQCGAVGPVALAAARLARLLGDADTAAEYLQLANEVAQHAGGPGAMLHCLIEAALWAASDAQDPGPAAAARANLAALAREADASGRPGLAERARSVK